MVQSTGTEDVEVLCLSHPQKCLDLSGKAGKGLGLYAQSRLSLNVRPGGESHYRPLSISQAFSGTL